jgi:hypothetical protein
MDSSDLKPTRRTAILQFAGSAAVLPILGQQTGHHAPAEKPATPVEAYAYRFFSPQQVEALDALGETIIPVDDHSPGAKAARVSEYIDAIVFDSPAKVKTLWTDGLAAIDGLAQEKFQSPYAKCSPERQTIILTAFSEDDFFQTLKLATVNGYYTSAIGIFQDLQYQGNQALPGFPGCGHMEDSTHQ